MQKTIMLGTLCTGFIFVIVFVVMLLYRKKQQTTNKSLEISSKRNAKNYLHFLYRIYMVTPVVRRYFLKIKNRYRTIFPADEITLNLKTTIRMTLCLGITTAILVVVAIVCKGDLPYMVVGMLSCYIIFTNMVNSSQESLNIKLLDQMDTFITDVNAYYHDTEMVEEAIADTLDDLPYEIGLHANKIYNIVTATEVEIEVEKYIDVAPNKFLLLFAAICASVKEYGDKKMENGKSLFAQNLNFLKAELNLERIRLKKRDAAFKGKVFSVLISLFVLKPIELAMAANLPDIKNFYTGSGGMISMAVISVIALISYEAINALKDDHSEEGKDNKIFKLISELPGIKSFLKLQIEHNYSKSRRISETLKSVGDKSGINVFTIKRYLLAIVLFIATNCVAFSAIAREKDLILNDFTESYTEALVPNEEYREQMRQISLSLNGEIKKPNTTAALLYSYIDETLEGDMATMVVEELLSRKLNYESYYYRWYVLLLSIAVGVIGYYIPVWLLKFKKSIVVMNQEDEVAQFRTLILILMHEDGMTLDTILEWMERFAHAFKTSISDCIINLEYSQSGAIEKMRDEEAGFAPFRRLCNSLLAVDKVGLEGAFDDLETEREYYQEKRKLDNEVLLNKCSRKANRIMMIPIYAIVILYLIIPFGYMAMNMYMEFDAIL